MNNVAAKTNASNAKILSRGYAVLETKRVNNAKQSAELFGAILAADLGVASRLVRVSAKVWDCVASDNRAMRYVTA